MIDISMELQAIHDEAALYVNGREMRALAGGEMRVEFHRRWPDIRDGLHLVKTFVPAAARIAVDVLVAAGDGAHGAIGSDTAGSER